LQAFTLQYQGEGDSVRLSVAVIVAVGILLVLPAFLAPALKANQSPIASFAYSPDFPAPEQIITFDASASSDPDGTIVQYRWDFSDGSVLVGTVPVVTHSYPVDGNYTVELTVTDNNGAIGTASAIVQVQTVVFFRVVTLGTLNPVSDVEVTLYYNNGSAWVKTPVGPSGLEIKYDNMTQPDLANSDAERYRNPGFTASILRSKASNIGFDIRPAGWNVFFKFKWGQYEAYWPNDPSRVYSYYKGEIETRYYAEDHRAWWDAAASTYVIRAGDIPGSGVSPTSDHPIIIGIMCTPPPQKYYLTTRTDPSSITAIPGEGWYNKDSSATLTAPATVDVTTGTRYRFNYWDVDGVARDVGVNPITFTMDANHTTTAHYVLQYSVVFDHTGLASDSAGTVVTVNGSAKTYSNLPYTFWVDSGLSFTYSYASIVSSSTSGKQFRLNSVSGPASPITVSGPASVVGNYVTQYLVTFAQVGLDSTATGTVVTVNGSAKAYTSLPYQWWVDSGSALTYSYSSIVSSTTPNKRFRLTSIQCPPSQFIVAEPATIIGYYCTQYSVSFGQYGLDSSAAGTVVTVNGTSKTYSELPYALWVDSGSSIVYSYTSSISSSSPNKRFRLNSTTGPASPVTVTAPTTVTGNYVIQYMLTFAQTGLDSSATGTVVSVNGGAKTYGDLPYLLWADSGSSVTYSYTSTVPSSVGGKRFRLDTVSGHISPITVIGPITVTGNYVTQYQVTFAHAGLDSTATGIVVTVNGPGKTYSDLPYSFWTDSGSTVTYSYSNPVPSSTSGKQFRLNSVSGLASPISVTESTTVTGNYVVQYQVTFAQTGLDSTATGAVVAVNDDTKEATDLPYSLWIDSGLTVTYSYNDIVLSTTTGKRFSRTSVSGPSSPITVASVVTVTGNYKIQYQIAFDQSGVQTDFTGTITTVDSVNYNFNGLPTSFWWDKDSSHNFAYASPLTVNASRQYTWSSTSGLSNLQGGTLIATASGSITGNYIIQNSVTFDAVGVGLDFTGAVLTVDGTPYSMNQMPVSFVWQIGTAHSFSFQSPAVASANVKRYVWTSTTGLSTLQSGSINVTMFGSIIGNYKTQYYLNLTANPPGTAAPSGSGWYDTGSFASISTAQYVPAGSRWRFTGWTTGNMSEITDPMSPDTTILIDEGKTVTAQYVHQYWVTFAQTGLASDASGTVVTVNGTSSAYTELPYTVWVDEGGILAYSYETAVSSTLTGKQSRLDSVTGSSSPITVTADTTVTGNYVIQYYLTVSSAHGTISGQGWYDDGATAHAGLASGIVNHGNGTRRAFTNWNGDATGNNYASSNPITMNGPKTATAAWKTQYFVTFAQSGLDSSASGTIMAVGGVSKMYAEMPYSDWFDANLVVTYAYSNVSSSTAGKRFILTGVAGPSSPITVSIPLTFTGNYKTQYQITFSHTGVGPDFTGNITVIDGAGYSYGALPSSFWWDSGSSHLFGFASPLILNASKQYIWTSTSGLSPLQNGTLVVASSGSVTGNYVTQGSYEIIFGQTGVGTDFNGTVLTVDGANYRVADLPHSFWWGAGEIHNFAYQSPLEVSANVRRYVWTSTSGLASSQSGSITVAGSGSVTGSYKTQYYLMLATSPASITSPSGAGWYDVNTLAPVSTAAFVDIIAGSSRYRFNGWSTPDMAEIANPTVSPATVLMDKGKTVTANYVTQYNVTFSQTGVGPDFPGPIVNIDARDYNYTGLTTYFWWDIDSVHTFAYLSPLVVTPNSKQYVWTSTSGLSTSQSGSITVTTSGSVTGNYKTQYYLTVFSPYGTTNGQGWYDSGTTAYAGLTAGIVNHGNGTRRTFTLWNGDASGANYVQSDAITMNAPKTATANWKTHYYLTVSTMPGGVAGIPGEGWYDVATTVTLVAPPISGYNFLHWTVDGISQGEGITTIGVLTNSVHGAVAYYSSITPTPVGGHSISLTENTSASQVATYFMLLAAFGAMVSLAKREKK